MSAIPIPRSASYRTKDIQVLEGLEPVRKRPAMYIGGVDAKGLHHLVWEIVDNAVDEYLNGYADHITVTLHKSGDAVTVTDNGRGIPVDMHPKYKKSRPRADPHHAALRRQVRRDDSGYIHSGGLHGVGSSVVNALSKKLVATVSRDGYEYRQDVRQGQADRRRSRRSARSAATARPSTSSRTPTIFKTTHFDPDMHQGPPRGHVVHPQRPQDHLQERDHRRDATTWPTPAASRVPRRSSSADGAEAGRDRGRRSPRPRDNGEQDGGRPAVDRIDRRDVSARYVNGIRTPHGGTHENGLKAASRKAVRNYIETHDIKIKGLKITAEDIREGIVGVLSVFVREPKFQGQTKERLNNPEMDGDGRQLRPPRAGGVAEQQHDRRGPDRRPHRAGRQGPRGVAAPRPARSSASRPAAAALNLPGKLADCKSTDLRRDGAVHRRGRLRRRLRQAGPQQQHAGRAAAARQDPQRRRPADREGAGQPGAGRPGHRHRHRRRRQVQHRRPALRQDHPAHGRRRRRPPHHDAAARLLLPPHAGADPQGARLHRPAAALPHRRRQGDALGPRRRAQGGDPRRAAGQRQAGDHALQGPRRDAVRGAGGDDARPQDAHAAEGGDRLEPARPTRRFVELLGKDAAPRYKFIMEKADQTIAEDLDV